MEATVKITNRNNGKTQNVSEAEADAIKNNPNMKNLYTFETKAPKPKELQDNKPAKSATN